MTPTRARTDRHNNPCAIITLIAEQAGLKKGVEYEDGDLFPQPSTLRTARLLGDPIALTIKVIDAVGYYTKAGTPRWSYIAIPKFVWDSLTPALKKRVIAFHYTREGGSEMKGLFG